VKGKVLKWVRKWLQGRTGCVVLGQARSNSCDVDSGMPQGTILGPILFTVQIDDIDLVAELSDMIIKFADDTKGAQEINSEEDKEKLQTTLDIGQPTRLGQSLGHGV
jgi:hypothetical protein